MTKQKLITDEHNLLNYGEIYLIEKISTKIFKLKTDGTNINLTALGTCTKDRLIVKTEYIIDSSDTNVINDNKIIVSSKHTFSNNDLIKYIDTQNGTKTAIVGLKYNSIYIKKIKKPNFNYDSNNNVISISPGTSNQDKFVNVTIQGTGTNDQFISTNVDNLLFVHDCENPSNINNSTIVNILRNF